MTTRRIDVSICIATYRRPAAVAALLESFARMKLPEGVGVEVVLVDNDPASDPAHPVAEGMTLPGVTLRRLREPRRSPVHARARAIEAAAGRWLAFVDDDARVDEGWLEALWRCVEERDADGFFGPVSPRGEGDDGLFQNLLLRRPLFRDVRLDLALVAGEAERAWLSEVAHRGARFEWCGEASVRTALRPGRRPGRRWRRRSGA